MPNVVSKTALKRRSELVEAPKELKIHESFLINIEKDKFSTAFRTVYKMFSELRSYLEKNFMLEDSNWLFFLLLYLFASGKSNNGVFTVDLPSFRKANKGTKTVKHCEKYLKILSEHGFVFEGLKNYKIPNNAKTLTIKFTEMPAVVDVLHLVAEKCHKYKDFYSIALFFTWNYRLIEQAQDEMEFEGHEVVLDGLTDKTEKDFVLRFHEAMKENSFVCKKKQGNGDGELIRYFENEKQLIYLFEIASNINGLNLKLRIRDAKPCLEYLEQCPESIKDMFRQDFRQAAPECINKQYCEKALNYIYEGKYKWHCACYGASFQGVPIIIENIPHYIELVKLGKVKGKEII